MTVRKTTQRSRNTPQVFRPPVVETSFDAVLVFMSSGISEVTQDRLAERCVKILRGIRFVTRLELREKHFCEFWGGGFRN